MARKKKQETQKLYAIFTVRIENKKKKKKKKYNQGINEGREGALCGDDIQLKKIGGGKERKKRKQ